VLTASARRVDVKAVFDESEGLRFERRQQFGTRE